MQKGIGLFGGSFDPVHTGHLAVARGALDALDLIRLDFVLAPAPWQKSIITPVHKRLAMLELACEADPRMRVNPCELMREGATYTVDTLRQMRRELGPSVPLVLILGADQWENFHTWRDWEVFTQYCSIALCNRNGRTPQASPVVSAWAEPHLCPAQNVTRSACGQICQFEIPAHEASSTRIREIFSRCGRYEALRQLEGWLPAKVARYIAMHGVYF